MNKPLNIVVQTHTNGYALTVGDKEYFYFTLETLIQGIAYHAVDDFNQDAELHNIASTINSHVTLFKHVREDSCKLLDTIAKRDTTILALKEELASKKKQCTDLLHELKKWNTELNTSQVTLSSKQ